MHSAGGQLGRLLQRTTVAAIGFLTPLGCGGSTDGARGKTEDAGNPTVDSTRDTGPPLDVGLPSGDAGADGENPSDGSGTIDAGSTCAGSRSCAELLLAKQFNLVRLVVGPTSLFTRSSLLGFSFPSGNGLQGIFEIPFDGRIPRQMADRGSNEGFGMALSATSLFGCDEIGEGVLWRVPLLGGSIEPIVNESGGCYDVVTTITHAYFTNSALGQVSRVPLGGGAVEMVASGFSSAQNLAVDGTTLYWSVGQWNGSRYVGDIYSMPLAGGEPKSLALGVAPSKVAGLELDTDWIYWQDEEGGVRRLSKKGPTQPEPPPLWGAAIRSGCFDFAVDDRFIYCTLAQQVIRTPKESAGTAEVLAAGLEPRTELIAVDSTHIYFTVAGPLVPTQSTEADRIYRMPKP